ncbi:MAG TPA: hypothetical protein VK066_25960 [Chloroflexota bacterium]|nr:hypothetical protein [Chloroflexota bacterium]
MAVSDRSPLSDAARAMAAARRVVGPVRCEECGAEVMATTAGRYKRRYCSPRCRARAYYRAHRAELTDRQRERRAVRRGELPVDPVPLSPKEAAMMAASAADMARGDYLTDAELDALLAREA